MTAAARRVFRALASSRGPISPPNSSIHAAAAIPRGRTLESSWRRPKRDDPSAPPVGGKLPDRELPSGNEANGVQPRSVVTEDDDDTTENDKSRDGADTRADLQSVLGITSSPWAGGWRINAAARGNSKSLRSRSDVSSSNARSTKPRGTSPRDRSGKTLRPSARRPWRRDPRACVGPRGRRCRTPRLTKLKNSASIQVLGHEPRHRAPPVLSRDNHLSNRLAGTTGPLLEVDRP